MEFNGEDMEELIHFTKRGVKTVRKPIKIYEGDIKLAAFLNVSNTFSMDTKELSRRIKEKLPSFMIFSSFKFKVKLGLYYSMKVE